VPKPLAAVFPRAATPTDLGGGVVGGLGGVIGMGAGGMVGPMGGSVYGFGRDEIEGMDGGLRASTSQWSCPQSPSEFFSWSTGEYAT